MQTPFLYVDCDIPEGVTVLEWRRKTTKPARRRFLRKR